MIEPGRRTGSIGGDPSVRPEAAGRGVDLGQAPQGQQQRLHQDGAELPRTAPWAAGGLTALLVGLFPVNVYAALNGITTSPEDALVPRTLMQLVFLAATVAVLASSVRGRRLRWRSAVAPASAQG